MNIVIAAKIDPDVDQIIEAGLEAHGKAFVPGGDDLVPLQVVCRDQSGKTVGGLTGNTGNGWLHIWQFWVAETHRKQGIGSALLEAAEAEAIDRGCSRAHVETLSFQAVTFYRQRGYEEFAVLPEYVGPHAQHFLRKSLVG